MPTFIDSASLTSVILWFSLTNVAHHRTQKRNNSIAKIARGRMARNNARFKCAVRFADVPSNIRSIVYVQAEGRKSRFSHESNVQHLFLNWTKTHHIIRFLYILCIQNVNDARRNLFCEIRFSWWCGYVFCLYWYCMATRAEILEKRVSIVDS